MTMAGAEARDGVAWRAGVDLRATWQGSSTADADCSSYC